MKVQSRFIEMFGVPANSTKGKRGEELFTFSSGKANTKSNLDPSFQYNCYGGNGITGKSKDYLLKDKTIVIGRVGEYCGCVHKTTDYCWITDNAIYLKTYSDLYRFEFIYHMFTMMDFHRFASETGQPKITQAPLLSCHYPLPSLEEQNKFVAIAEQADKSKFVGFKSRFIEMVGDPRSNPKGWPMKRLPDVASYSIGLTYKPEHVCEDGTIVLRSGNIQEGEIDLQDLVRVNTPIRENLWVKEGDILMCSRNGSASLVGKVAQIKLIQEPMTYGAFMTIIRSEYSDYLYLYFQSADFRDQISGGKSTTMNQITQKMLDKIEIPLPDQDVISSLSAILKQADKSKYYYQIA